MTWPEVANNAVNMIGLVLWTGIATLFLMKMFD